MIDLSRYCAQCGKPWDPSKDESSSFPGSGCDTGECICIACENRIHGDCSFHEELRGQGQHEASDVQREMSDVLKRVEERFWSQHRAFEERTRQSLEVVQRLLQRQAREIPSLDVIRIAECLTGRIEACVAAVRSVQEARPDADLSGVRAAFEQLREHSRELHRRLGTNAALEGKSEVNELIRLLLELPESQRFRLSNYDGISPRLQLAFRAFWCAQ